MQLTFLGNFSHTLQDPISVVNEMKIWFQSVLGHWFSSSRTARV